MLFKYELFIVFICCKQSFGIKSQKESAFLILINYKQSYLLKNIVDEVQIKI